MRRTPNTAAWLARLPTLVDAARERWGFSLGDPFDGGVTSWVAPAALPDGTDAVVKIQYPDHETRHEAAALMLWGGEGAVRLIDHDPDTSTLLLERCRPGHPLSTVEPGAALQVLAELVDRITVAAGEPFADVADEADGWLDALDHHLRRWPGSIDGRLLGAARRFLDELVAGARVDRVLVHQDLHGGNVLAAGRDPWLVIDPKPLLATAEFALAPIVRSVELGVGRDAALHRLDVLVDRLELDRQSAIRHTIAQTVAWAFTPDGPIARHIELASWLLDEAV